MANKKIAFVGSGYMTTEHAKAFASIDGVTLAGIYGRNPVTAKELASKYQMPAVQNLSELYEKTNADLVVVSVDELSLMGVCESIFKSPWAILLEKPPGHTLDIASALNAMATENGRDCFVALNRRFMSSALNARSLLNSSTETRFITVTDQEDLTQANELGQPAEIQSNWMYANSIHVIDLLRFFGRGKIVDVKNILPWHETREASMVAAAIHFDSGDTGLYKAIWNAPGPWSTEIVTASQRFELRPLETLQKQVRGKRTLEPIPTHTRDTDFKPGLRLQAEHAIRMLSGDSSHELPTLEDALETMRLIRRIYWG